MVFHSRRSWCSGLKTIEKLLEVFLRRAARLFIEAGGSLDTRNQTIIVLRRTDRDLIHAMNGARLRAWHEIKRQWDERGVIAWDEVEDRLNKIPFSANDYVLPKHGLARVLASSR